MSPIHGCIGGPIKIKLYKVTEEPLLTNTESKMWNHPHGPPGVEVKILKRLYFVFYVIAKIINKTAFSPLGTSVTSPTVLSVHKLILTVWPWWESLLTTSYHERTNCQFCVMASLACHTLTLPVLLSASSWLSMKNRLLTIIDIWNLPARGVSLSFSQVAWQFHLTLGTNLDKTVVYGPAKWI